MLEWLQGETTIDNWRMLVLLLAGIGYGWFFAAALNSQANLEDDNE